MTKKDYILLASAIKDSIDFTSDNSIKYAKYTALHIAEALKKENDRFDITKFLVASGYSAVDLQLCRSSFLNFKL